MLIFENWRVKGPWWCCQWLLECDEAAEAEVRTSVKRDLYHNTNSTDLGPRVYPRVLITFLTHGAFDQSPGAKY
jgi:hypothetical protein